MEIVVDIPLEPTDACRRYSERVEQGRRVHSGGRLGSRSEGGSKVTGDAPRRAVVTGLGVVSPIGCTVEEYWKNLTAGVSGIDCITLFDAENLRVRIAGEVKGFEPGAYMPEKEARRMDRFAQFAVAVSRMALDDAGLQITEANAEQVGIVMNTGSGGVG